MNINFCQNCGTEFKSDSLFCPNCGLRRSGFTSPNSTTASVSDAKAPFLHWGLVLLLSIVTLGIFADVWVFIQYKWVQKIDPNNKSFPWIAAAMIVMSVSLLAGHSFAPLVLVLFSIGAYKMKQSIEMYYNELGIDRQLNTAYVILGSIFYLQYHLTKISKIQERKTIPVNGVSN